MGNDLREKFVSDIMKRVATLQELSVDSIQNIVILSISEYEISERCTKIAIRSCDQNDVILNNYCGCLYVDGKSEKTIKLYRRQLERLSDAIRKPFHEITTYDIRLYLAKLKNQNASSTTLENYRAYFSAFFQWMLREELIDKDPCAKILPIKCEKVDRYPFSEQDIDAMRMGCKYLRDRAIIEVLLTSGIRASELCSLMISDIDFQNLSVQVRCGKGGKDRKTYMSSLASKYLREYLESRTDNIPYLFVTIRDSKKIDSNSLEKMLKKLGKSTGVSNVHPHRFRRTFATNLSKRGLKVHEIAKLMGHASIQTTLGYVYIDDVQIANSYRMYTA